MEFYQELKSNREASNFVILPSSYRRHRNHLLARDNILCDNVTSPEQAVYKEIMSNTCSLFKAPDKTDCFQRKT